jgi:hypothetical protein
MNRLFVLLCQYYSLLSLQKCKQLCALAAESTTAHVFETRKSCIQTIFVVSTQYGLMTYICQISVRR